MNINPIQQQYLQTIVKYEITIFDSLYNSDDATEEQQILGISDTKNEFTDDTTTTTTTTNTTSTISTTIGNINHQQQQFYTTCLINQKNRIYTEYEKLQISYFNNFVNNIIWNIQQSKTRKPYKCGKCLKPFKQILNLEICPNCTNNRIYSCIFCTQTFFYVASLLIHINEKEIFEKGMTLKCFICFKKFKTSIAIEQHMNKHTGENPYKCFLCNNMYGNAFTFRQHITVEHMTTESQKMKLRFTKKLCSLNCDKENLEFNELSSAIKITNIKNKSTRKQLLIKNKQKS